MNQALKNFNKGKWQNLGRELRLRQNLLNEINADYQKNGVGECLYQALEAWLKEKYDKDKFGPPTWHSLANAVEISDDPALADEIRAQHQSITL